MTDRNEFSLATKLKALRKSKFKCAACGFLFKPKQFECDHITPCAFSEDNTEANIQVLCLECHAKKTRGDLKLIAKSNRITAKHFGLSREGTVRGWRK